MRYWVEAARIYEESCRFHQDAGNTVRLAEDRLRLKIIMTRLVILENDESQMICGIPARILHSTKKRTGIDRVCAGRLEPLCPQCRQPIKQDHLNDLKRYRAISCTECGLLFLPMRLEVDFPRFTGESS